MQWPPETERVPLAEGGTLTKKTDQAGGLIKHNNKPRPQIHQVANPPTQAAIFTARPVGAWWSVAAISDEGQAVKLGCFPHRKDALSATAVMAGVCGARWLP